MKLRLLGGPVEDFRCIMLCTCSYFEGIVCELCGGPARKKCGHCGNDFDLRRVADPEPGYEWICGSCVAGYRGGQAAIDAYVAQHAKHYALHGVPGAIDTMDLPDEDKAELRAWVARGYAKVRKRAGRQRGEKA